MARLRWPLPPSGRFARRGGARRRRARLPQPSLALLGRLGTARRRAGMSGVLSGRRARRWRLRRHRRAQAIQSSESGDAVAGRPARPESDCHWSAICTRSKRPEVHLILEAWAAQYGTIYQFWMGGTRVVATSDPALIDEALRARPETFRRSPKTDGHSDGNRHQGRLQRRGRSLAPAAQAGDRGARPAQPAAASIRSIATVARAAEARAGSAAAARGEHARRCRGAEALHGRRHRC